MSRTLAVLNGGVKLRCFPIPHDEVMHTGRRIKQLMAEKGLTNERAALACGVTPGAVSNWFATGHITRENLVVIADLLGESVRYLITGDERDRAGSEIAAEFAQREVNAGTRAAILTLLRACPMRQDPTPAPDDPAGDADAKAFQRATAPLEIRPAESKPGRPDRKRH